MWQPTKLGRAGPRGTWDPFYEFEQLARDHGEPPEPAQPPKSELVLLEVLSSKAALMVMSGLAVAVALVLLGLLVLRL